MRSGNELKTKYLLKERRDFFVSSKQYLIPAPAHTYAAVNVDGRCCAVYNLYIRSLSKRNYIKRKTGVGLDNQR